MLFSLSDGAVYSGAERGRCGATAEVIVTRDLVRRTAGGASAHIEHARAAALTLKLAASGASPYSIKDTDKLILMVIVMSR